MGIVNVLWKSLNKVDNTPDNKKSVLSSQFPVGFNNRNETPSWGNQVGQYVTDWQTASRSDIQFREKDSQLYTLIDGFFYQNEGRYLVLDTNNFSTYAAAKDHTHSNYLPLNGGTMTGTIIMRNSFVTAQPGTAGKNGYVLIAQIKVGGIYQNAPIEFEIARRNDSSSTFIYVRFLNANNSDPGLASFNAVGSTGAIYINKSATSTWDIYVKKTESYDEIGILSYHKPSYMNATGVTYPGTHVDALPSDCQQVTYTYLPYKTGTIARLEDINKTITDWNTATTSCIYYSAKGASNAPVSDVGITGNVSAIGNMIVQTAYPESIDDSELVSYTRKGINSSGTITWSKWIKNIEYLKSFVIKGYDTSSKNNLFNQLIPNTVTSIYFTDIKMPSNATLIDVDDDGDNGVVAWLDTNDNTKMYVSTQHKGVKVEANNNIENMFYTKNIKRIYLSNFDTSNVTNMNGMFSTMRNMESLYLSNFDTSNVTDMSSMFEQSDFTYLDLSNFDTSNVTDMSNMFYGCRMIKSLDLSNFDTSNVTNMNGMFYANYALNSINVSNWDTSKVTTMYNLFYQCMNLTSLDLSSWDTSNITTMFQMFRMCTKLATIKVGAKFKWPDSLSTMQLIGTWQDETGTQYTSSSTFPSNAAHTYTKV